MMNVRGGCFFVIIVRVFVRGEGGVRVCAPDGWHKSVRATGGKFVSHCVCFPDGEQIHEWHLLKENPTRLFVAWQIDR